MDVVRVAGRPRRVGRRIDPRMTIAEAIARATEGTHPEHRVSVEASAMALLMALGVEGVRDRVRLSVVGERPDAVHELSVDGRAVWRGVSVRGRWVSTWIERPWTLSG